MGKGLNVLFAGPSGTGKTMAAEIMAGELGLDLYKIDLSTVVSKYIGETEKNLARIFSEAETSNAILFFDEADALFGKRSEVRDAHDRYANIEISYLLQRMEEYDGMVILATNLRKNLDDAFVRRMHFTVEFPFPDEAHRRRIWQKIWPAETPRAAPDAGSGLHGPALRAGRRQHPQHRPGRRLPGRQTTARWSSMAHLIHATQREYQKMGKVVVDGEFGDVRKPGAPGSGERRKTSNHANTTTAIRHSAVLPAVAPASGGPPGGAGSRRPAGLQRDPTAQLACRVGDASCAGAHAEQLDRTTVQPARDSLLRLQREYGNRFVQRVVDLSRKEDDGSDVSPEVEQGIQAARGGGQPLDSRPYAPRWSRPLAPTSAACACTATPGPTASTAR